jgi:hypothetical protein
MLERFLWKLPIYNYTKIPSSGSRPYTFGPDGGRMDMTKEYVGAFRDYANACKNMLRNYVQHKL